MRLDRSPPEACDTDQRDRMAGTPAASAHHQKKRGDGIYTVGQAAARVGVTIPTAMRILRLPPIRKYHGAAYDRLVVTGEMFRQLCQRVRDGE